MKAVCPDCGAEMQRVYQMFRCPWANEERVDQTRWRNAPFVSCRWPLEHPRRIEGLPDEPRVVA